MQQWNEFERSQQIREPKKNYLSCKECGSQWLQSIKAAQFDADKISTIGQEPPTEVDFIILKCVRCGELHEPPISRVFNHPETKVYDKLLDALQEPEEKWGGRREALRNTDSGPDSVGAADDNEQPADKLDKS